MNVFDFLVNGETPNASNVSLGGTRAQMEMKPTARPLFGANQQSSIDSGTDHEYDSAFERDGYAYGHEPVPSNASRKQIEYKTPGPKKAPYASNQGSLYELDGAERKSTDKKRKRHNVDDLDLTAARPPSRQELDSVMLDAPAPVLHSGLTGGLNKLLSKSTRLPPSPEYSNGSQQDRSPPTVVKRTKRVITTVDGEKVRKNSSGALVRVRKIPTSRRPSDESNRPRKQPRSSKEDGDAQRDIRPKRTPKAIEYHPSASSSRAQQQQDPQQMVLYRSRAKLFLSFVNKGPESEQGCSINKALKRYHRERAERGLGKQEEEKELWKSLRVKRNERGEVVILGA